MSFKSPERFSFYYMSNSNYTPIYRRHSSNYQRRWNQNFPSNLLVVDPLNDCNNKTLQLEFERVNLEKERIAFERMKLLERERYLEEQEQRVRQEQARLEAERDLLQREGVKQRRPSQENYQAAPSPGGKNGHDSSGISPKMRAFLSDLLKHNRKIVEVTYDRVKQHEKELTVIRGEYLDVLSDEKNWWECRNSQNNVGFVPHTILSVITPEDAQALLSGAGNGHINVS